MGRITKAITFNLADRGRKESGQDRSNLSIPDFINMINSPGVQEFVKSRQLMGFCGHQVRQLYGMNPPETVMIDGKQVHIEPASCTVYLHADSNGNVTHKQEFFDNEVGRHVERQYAAKIGGFSQACSCLPGIDGLLRPKVFAGFDYVFQPNFIENASIGLFDSANTPDGVIDRERLESELIHLYDNIGYQDQQADYLNETLKRAKKAEKQLKILQKERELRLSVAQNVSVDIFDHAHYPSSDFQDRLLIARTFTTAQTVKKQDEVARKQQAKTDQALHQFGQFLGSGGA